MSDEEADIVATRRAGNDAGYILKKLLKDDKREFESRKNYVRQYRWTGRTK